MGTVNGLKKVDNEWCNDSNLEAVFFFNLILSDFHSLPLYCCFNFAHSVKCTKKMLPFYNRIGTLLHIFNHQQIGSLKMHLS